MMKSGKVWKHKIIKLENTNACFCPPVSKFCGCLPPIMQINPVNTNVNVSTVSSLTKTPTENHTLKVIVDSHKQYKCSTL